MAVKTRRALLALTALPVLVCACGGATVSSQARQAFLNSLYSQVPGISSYRSGDQLVNMAQAICSELSAGATVGEAADRAQLVQGSVPLPTYDLGMLMAAAVDQICPQFREDLGQ